MSYVNCPSCGKPVVLQDGREEEYLEEMTCCPFCQDGREEELVFDYGLEGDAEDGRLDS